MIKIEYIIVLMVLYVLMKNPYGCSRERFSLSKRPFEEENTLLMQTPVDHIDYQTPMFIKSK